MSSEYNQFKKDDMSKLNFEALASTKRRFLNWTILSCILAPSLFFPPYSPFIPNHERARCRLGQLHARVHSKGPRVSQGQQVPK